MLLNMHKTKWEKWHTTSTVKMRAVYRLHMGPEDPSNKKIISIIFFKDKLRL